MFSGLNLSIVFNISIDNVSIMIVKNQIAETRMYRTRFNH